MSTIYLMCGAIGAGKTTFALKLCDQLGAVHFWMDDWIEALFGADAPNVRPLFYQAWVAERLARCEMQMVKMAIECGWRGLPSVLDLGFVQAHQRHRVIHDIGAAGLRHRLYVLDANPEERWRRVIARNTQQDESYRVRVDRRLFDLVEALWEPPTSEEINALNGIYIGAGPSAREWGHLQQLS